MPIPENTTIISLKVQPNANRNEIVGLTNGILHVKIAAPPVKGKANKEIIIFLSKLLGTSKDSISIIKGQTSRNKLVAIKGLGQDSISKLLLQSKDT